MMSNSSNSTETTNTFCAQMTEAAITDLVNSMSDVATSNPSDEKLSAEAKERIDRFAWRNVGQIYVIQITRILLANCGGGKNFTRQELSDLMDIENLAKNSGLEIQQAREALDIILKTFEKSDLLSTPCEVSANGKDYNISRPSPNHFYAEPA